MTTNSQEYEDTVESVLDETHHDQPLQLVLLLAEMVTGSTVMFGVPIHAASYDSALSELLNIMNRENGQRFIPAINMQYLNTVAFIVCPMCDTAGPLSAGCCVNPDCQADYNEPHIRKAITEDPKRIINKVKYSLKALLDGTENKIMIRPENLLCYDIVSEHAPSYKKWKAVAEQSIEQMRALRSSIEIPTAAEVSAVRRAQQGGGIIRP